MEGALGSPSDWALPAARAVHYAALTLLFGGLLFPAYALAKGGRRAPPALLTAFWIEAWVAVASAVAVYALGVAGMAGGLASALDLPLLATTLWSDPYGQLFAVRVVLLLACAVLLARRRPPAITTWLAGLALAGLCLSGHAVEGGGWRRLIHPPLDALHLLSAGLWIGALPWFGALLKSDPPEPALTAVRRFSGVAAAAVAVLLVTGAMATLLLVGSPLKLLTTLWGGLLLVKVALAAAMVGLALHNRQSITPRLALGDLAARAALRRNARLELGLALLIVALVGLIGTLPFEPMAM